MTFPESAATSVLVECRKGCGAAAHHPSKCLLVKAFGKPMRVIFTCPTCGEHQFRDAPADKVGQLTVTFRAAGNPLVQLPPQGDLPWPAMAYDDVLDFALSFDSEMSNLLEGF